MELLFVNDYLNNTYLVYKLKKIRYKICMLYYIHEKLQSGNSGVTLIVNILFSVSVCMSKPLIRQDDHRNKFSTGNKFFFPLKI